MASQTVLQREKVQSVWQIKPKRGTQWFICQSLDMHQGYFYRLSTKNLSYNQLREIKGYELTINTSSVSFKWKHVLRDCIRLFGSDPLGGTSANTGSVTGLLPQGGRSRHTPLQACGITGAFLAQTLLQISTNF